MDLLFANRNDEAADDNQYSTENDGTGRIFREGQPGNRLGHEEKNCDVDAQETPELPRWRVNNVAIGCQDQAAGDEEIEKALLSSGCGYPTP